MPHIVVKMVAGKSEEAKKVLTQKLVAAITSTINDNPDSVSVAIEDIPADKWKSEVYEPDIMSCFDALYKQPGYEL